MSYWLDAKIVSFYFSVVYRSFIFKINRKALPASKYLGVWAVICLLKKKYKNYNIFSIPPKDRPIAQLKYQLLLVVIY